MQRPALLLALLVTACGPALAPEPGPDDVAGDGDGDGLEVGDGDGDGLGDGDGDEMISDLPPPDMGGEETETGDSGGSACCLCDPSAPWCEPVADESACEALGAAWGLPSEWYPSCSEPLCPGSCS